MGDWKKVYSAPRLTAYGHVTTLTQSGTMGGSENVNMVGTLFML